MSTEHTQSRGNLSAEYLPALLLVTADGEWDLSGAPGIDGMPKWSGSTDDRELAIAFALVDLAHKRLRSAICALEAFGLDVHGTKPPPTDPKAWPVARLLT